VTDASRFGRPTLVVVLVALAVYIPSLANGFTFDDERDIRDNPAIADATGRIDVAMSPSRGEVPAARSLY
jgi:hypothetical protein